MPGNSTYLRVLRSACLTILAAASLGLSALPAAPLRVGVEPGAEPFTSVDAAGQPIGFTIDLLRAIAARQHLELKFVVRPWDQLLAEFRAGRFDVIASIASTPERAAFVDFTAPYSHLPAGVFVQQDSPIKTIDQLHGRRFAVMSQGLSHDYVLRRGWAKAEDLILARDAVDGLAKLNAAECEVVFGSRLVLDKFIRDHGFTRIRRTEIELPDLDYLLRFGVRRGDRELLFQLNEGLHALRTDGTFDRLHEQWLGPLEPRRPKFSELRPYLMPVALLLMLTLIGLAWQRRVLARLRQQQAALKRSEERLTLVLEGGGHGFWHWDIPAHRIERNDLAASLLGYAPSELANIPEAWTRLIHPDDTEPFAALLRRLDHPGTDTFAFEYRMQAKDGQWRWIFSSGRVLERTDSGSPRRAAGTHTDITTRKLAEEERAAFQRKMLEAQKLESLGLLAGGIAHDFNNLLAVVLGNVTLAQLPDVEPETVAQAHGQIELAARRAADLCRQMLAYAGRGRLSVERLQLNALISDTTELLRLSLGKSSHLEFALAPDLPAVEGDASQLRQVVMNLVLNAAEALPPSGGRIRLATSLRPFGPADWQDAVHGRQLAPGDYVCLSIADTGSGMPPEVRAKIFDPFFTTKLTGRGLGLAAVLGIVRAHHGAFLVQSSPGVGSTFTLCLPPLAGAPAPRPASASPFAPPSPSPATTILIADDEPDVRSTASAILRHHGYRVIVAVDGPDAIRQFSASPASFAAVLLDLTMPGLDGLAALDQIRALQPDQPALLMSGFTAHDILARLPENERPDLLQKPFAQADLLAKLGEVLARRPAPTDAPPPPLG